MRAVPTPLPGVVLIELDAFADPRGYFVELYRRDRYRAAGIDAEFEQDNLSSSIRGSLRGLHYRIGRPEGKLVHVARGEIFDVAVDVRRSSPSFGRWFGTVLSAESHRQLWIPPGFAHGFYALRDAEVVYKVTGTYSPGDDRIVRWDDPHLAIAWPLTAGPPLLSAKDAAAPPLGEAELLP
jgi:dTDP-4-dehydrorhamnose 3,5-epimerase